MKDTVRTVEVIVDEVLKQVNTEFKTFKELAEEMFARMGQHIAAHDNVGPAEWGYSPRNPRRCDMCGQYIRPPKLRKTRTEPS